MPEPWALGDHGLRHAVVCFYIFVLSSLYLVIFFGLIASLHGGMAINVRTYFLCWSVNRLRHCFRPILYVVSLGVEDDGY